MNTYHKTEATAYALRTLPGVVDVLASAMLHQVVVQYDESLIAPAVIVHHLEGLGFVPHQDKQGLLVSDKKAAI